MITLLLMLAFAGATVGWVIGALDGYDFGEKFKLSFLYGLIGFAGTILGVFAIGLIFAWMALVAMLSIITVVISIFRK